MKTKSWLKYLAVFLVGFLTNFSGALENITKLPKDYHDFKSTYLYDRELLDGTWSTNTEYLINSKEAGIPLDQPKVVLTLVVDNNGGIEGDIISKKICDALPITWAISFVSESPDLTNIFVDRTLFIKQLHNSDMERVAKLKLVSQNSKYQTITFRTISDFTRSLPEFITFGKNLPSYKEDFKELSGYCAGSPMRKPGRGKLID